jgi:hypothetical protein
MFNTCFGVAYTAPVVAVTLPLARGIRLLIRFFTFILAKKHLQGLSSFGIPLLNHTYLSVCKPTPLYTGVRTTHNNCMIFVELGMNGARHFVPEHVNSLLLTTGPPAWRLLKLPARAKYWPHTI